MYGAALVRLLPGDFGEVRHPDGIAPAWPLSYDDMEPYYVRAEHLFWVHGKHGEDPFAGTSSKDYRYPPVQHEPRIQQLSDDLDKLGLHPFHLPLGVHLTQDAHGRATTASRCIRCDRVDGFPCLVGAKAAAALRTAVAGSLSERQRRVFVALVVEGVPLDALTAELGSTRNAIYKTMFDARRKIRAHLVAHGYLRAE